HLVDKARADLLKRCIEVHHGIVSCLERFDLALDQRLADRRSIDGRLVRPPLYGAGCDEVRTIAYRPGAAVGDERGVLKRENDGRKVVKRRKISRAEGKIPIHAKRI